jgi:transposase
LSKWECPKRIAVQARMDTRKPYPSDVSDEEWALISPYLELLPENSCQRKYSSREVFNALRYLVRSGIQWRMLPHDFPPWAAVYQQTRRWLDADVFADMMGDLRELLRLAHGKEEDPSACILDSRTLQSTPESGARAGYDAAKRRKGTKVHTAVDTLGYPLAVEASPANEQDRDHVAPLTEKVQDETGGTVDVAYVDQAYSGEAAAQAADTEGIELVVVKKAQGQRGFVLLPKRWVVERSFGWIARCRRLLRDFERLNEVLVGMHLVAFTCVMLQQVSQFIWGSS